VKKIKAGLLQVVMSWGDLAGSFKGKTCPVILNTHEYNKGCHQLQILINVYCKESQYVLLKRANKAGIKIV